MPMPVSIIIPTFNEGPSIKATLKPLQLFRLYGGEVIVADGGSTDNTREECGLLADHWVDAEKGRAKQMNAGAEVAGRKVLLFLHADTKLPNNFIHLLRVYVDSYAAWGRFDVRLSGDRKMFRVIEFMMNWRSRLTGIATGDQAIFVTEKTFHKVGGFPDQPLMEDVELSIKLKKLSKPFCIGVPLTTDSRRWEKCGVWKTIFLMWRLRFKYQLGVGAEQLHKQYYQ